MTTGMVPAVHQSLRQQQAFLAPSVPGLARAPAGPEQDELMQAFASAQTYEGSADGEVEGVAPSGFSAWSVASVTAAAVAAAAGMKKARMAKGGRHERVLPPLRRGRRTERRIGAAAGQAAASGKPHVAISGFGRIGRNLMRCFLGRAGQSPFHIVGVNIGSMKPSQAAHLLKYDTVMGTLDAEVVADDANMTLTIAGHTIRCCATRDPAQAPWKEWGVDIVLEATGAFTDATKAQGHIDAGAKKVIITAPGKECNMYVMGVNADQYDPKTEDIISNASCTTNGMAPLCKVLHEKYGIIKGSMTTVHAYTSDQLILDGRHKDPRRARAGAANIIPTSTGAAKAVGVVLPELAGKLDGYALRVPTSNVSLVDLVLHVERPVTSAAEVNAVLKSASEGALKGVLGYTEEPLVSSDFKGTDVSSTVDGPLTKVLGEDMVCVRMWYDNEWGYSQRVLDLTGMVATKM